MYVLGISAYYHDSAACLIKNNEIIAAAQEERFTRIKHDLSFPKNAINYCITEAKITPDKIDYFVFYEKPFLKFERLLETYFAFAPRGFKNFSISLPIWIKEKLFQKSLICKELKSLFKNNIDYSNLLLFNEHHLSHAASAFFPSPFKEAAVLTVDGVGEWSTTSIYKGKDNKLSLLKNINFPHSLGLLYSSFTYYLGFKVNSGEYKIMGLAPYGIPKYVDLIKSNLITINNDGSFKLNISYFDFCTELKMTNKKFDLLFGQPKRSPETKLKQFHMDVAASIQKITEEIILRICKNIATTTGLENLCLAGGVALNCVVNGILLKKKIFKNIWVQPAAGDAGGALGAALSVYYLKFNNKRNNLNTNVMKGSFLGPNFSSKEIKKSLNNINAIFKEYQTKEIIEKISTSLNDGKIIGLFNGRMEFGPRALGARSIIADPRNINMQRMLNLKIKYRESFRPFAPSILLEDVSEWFELNCESPYMLFVANVLKKHHVRIPKRRRKLFGIEQLNLVRTTIPAITHVDYSARIQTVSKTSNKRFYEIIKSFKKKTGCPIVVNTSFNIRGEPIVCSPEDAFRCFMGTEIDILVIENFFLEKVEQQNKFNKNYKEQYKLD